MFLGVVGLVGIFCEVGHNLAQDALRKKAVS
jgi:hypothetical protein